MKCYKNFTSLIFMLKINVLRDTRFTFQNAHNFLFLQIKFYCKMDFS